MTGQGRPPAIQVWAWPMTIRPDLDRSAVPAVPVRIGDAERDRAMSDLGDHFAAGRLTRDEFDARVDQAMTARFDRDLQPLFVDLPRAEPVPSRSAGPSPSLRAGWPLLLWWLPLLLVGVVVVTVLLGAPWLIWTFCWVLFISAFWGRRRSNYHHYRHYR
jgi:Domain of unknown function (DUF1707)